MSADPSKAEVIKAWLKPKDKTGKDFPKSDAILPSIHEIRQEKRMKNLCGCDSTIMTINWKDHQV